MVCQLQLTQELFLMLTTQTQSHHMLSTTTLFTEVDQTRLILGLSVWVLLVLLQTVSSSLILVQELMGRPHQDFPTWQRVLVLLLIMEKIVVVGILSQVVSTVITTATL